VKQQEKLIASMLLAASLIAAGIIVFFSASAEILGVTMTH
jgi:hypothetical protein